MRKPTLDPGLGVRVEGWLRAESLYSPYLPSHSCNTASPGGYPCPQKIRSLAVLPLKNLSGDSSQEYLADGITEALIGRLSGIHDLRVISRTSVALQGDQLSVPDIGKALHVDAVVEGSVIREGNHIRVHAQLIRAATDDHFWSEAMIASCATCLLLKRRWRNPLPPKSRLRSRRRTAELAAARSVPPQVYESYLQGQFAFDKSNSLAEIDESLRYFEEAISVDPTFAPAYVGLARAYDRLATVLSAPRPGRCGPK